MNLPENGRVVVIDDDYKEVESLLKVLSKNKVPVMYFTGILEELPEQPFSDVRIIFLDIELGTEGQPEKTKVSTTAGVIQKIIGNRSNPYLIIAWTKYDKLLNGIRKLLKDNPPLLMLNLEKSKCKDEKGKYEIGKIEEKLKEELKKAGIFHLFIIWENFVHNSAGKIVNDFSSFYSLDDNWNKNMCGVFHKLAKAYAGEQLPAGKVDELIKNALLAFNGTFLDTLENEIRNYIDIDKTLLPDDKGNIANDILAKVNSRLLLIFDIPDMPVPGNIYFNIKAPEAKIDELFNEKNIDTYQQKDDLNKKVKAIFLEVSPSCDYTQNKWKLHRVLPGVIWPVDYQKKINQADYIYTSRLFKIDNEIYKFVFDLRYLTSLSFDDLKDKRPEFRIRHELLIDIQSKIAGHINRPGVISLE
ncbi:MAG: hypothetical protein QME42_03445 [bacterium]|nr:hypothetical protein [bacterium]